MGSSRAYTDALRLLAGRDLSAAEVRERLLDRGHAEPEAAAAVEQLIEEGAVDDARLARAYARTAIDVKGRGRIRIARDLHARGMSRDVITAALAEVFGELDERTLVARAVRKKLRGEPPSTDPREHARLYQYLMRQGFSPAVVAAELRGLRGRQDDE